MLNESRLFAFIDEKNDFLVHFLEGQKLIHDLTLTHDLKANSLMFFRDTVLTSQHLVNFLKAGENLGFFIDSEDPYFRFKIEMNSNGLMRTLLLPEELPHFPNKISNGKARISKIFPGNTKPYNSIIDVNNQSLHQLVNSILMDSYQTNSRVFLSNNSDQSIMITKLPRKNIDKLEAIPEISIEEYLDKNLKKYQEIADLALSEEKEIITEFEKNNLSYLKSIEIKFQCNCSKERMLSGIASLTFQNSIDDIFEDKNSINVNCDYCKSSYELLKSEVLSYLVRN